MGLSGVAHRKGQFRTATVQVQYGDLCERVKSLNGIVGGLEQERQPSPRDEGVDMITDGEEVNHKGTTTMTAMEGGDDVQQKSHNDSIQWIGRKVK
jgi:hypothetical protein